MTTPTRHPRKSSASSKPALPCPEAPVHRTGVFCVRGEGRAAHAGRPLAGAGVPDGGNPVLCPAARPKRALRDAVVVLDLREASRAVGGGTGRPAGAAGCGVACRSFCSHRTARRRNPALGTGDPAERLRRMTPSPGGIAGVVRQKRPEESTGSGPGDRQAARVGRRGRPAATRGGLLARRERQTGGNRAPRRRSRPDGRRGTPGVRHEREVPRYGARPVDRAPKGRNGGDGPSGLRCCRGTSRRCRRGCPGTAG